MNAVRVIRAGLLTTVQDLGRGHLRHIGVSAGGAMDRISLELANRLVKNPADAAALEMTLSGDELHWECDAVIAVTGADLNPVVSEGSTCGTIVPQHTPVRIAAGTRIRFQTARRGCRSYLAVRGGFDLPIVLGSRSTLLTAKLGGYQGRALQAGDCLPVGNSPLEMMTDQVGAAGTAVSRVNPVDLPSTGCVTLRVLRGAHFDYLSLSTQQSLFDSEFQLTAQSDRMGFRLSGTILHQQTKERISEGISCGTIQLPPDGNPILLMADSAPTGGYSRIAHVISADLSAAAQIRPGQGIRFQETTMADAHTALRQQRSVLEKSLLMAELCGLRPYSLSGQLSINGQRHAGD